VEVLTDTTAVGVRDSKNPGGPEIFIDAPAWRTFVREVSAGGFDYTGGA